MPPKQLIRVNRLLRVCTILRSQGWQSLTSIAHDCGYYDQAHLNYDFRSLVGLTPTAFHLDKSISFFEID
jgi:AraC-like DNA-binding protein